MMDTLKYVEVEGKKKPFDITVYALSTCGFCRSALAFLKDNQIKYRYVYVDKLSSDERNKCKQFLRDNYEERLGFPFVVLDEKEAIVGYREEKWKEKFLK